MSKFLQRPMFRRGGSADGGITSGLRQGYNRGRVVNPGGYAGDEEFNLSEYITEAPELPKSRAGADFWLNFGSSILAQPGGRPILQTLGTAGQEPLKQYQQQKSKEDILKYKHGQGERQFQLEIYKAMSDDDKIALEKEINYLMEEHGLTKEEALARAMREHRLPMNPADIERQAKEAQREKIEKDAAYTASVLRTEEGESISIPQAIIVNEFYDQAHAQDPVWEYDTTPFIDKASMAEEWSAAGKKVEDWISPEGNIAIPPDKQTDYTEGFYYVDHFNGDVYQVGPGSTELIKIKLDEIKIN
jgi:hypothetical protein